MIITGKVLGTYSATDAGQKMPRPSVERLEMVVGHGIKGDKFAGQEMDKSVMIVGKIAYDMATSQGIALQAGSLGENILLDIDPHKLDLGNRISIGETVLEITENCSMCKHLTVFDSRLPRLLHGHRGRYCKVVQDGTVLPGDLVLIDKEEAA